VRVVTHPSEPSFLVLHALRLKGFAEDDVISGVSGLDAGEVGAHLKGLADDELVVRRDGRVSGWSLTPAGRTKHAALVADELAAAGARDAVKGAYERFLAINQDMLGVCTSWQLRDTDGTQAINDHSDAAYDQSVIDRLVGIHDRVRPVTVDLRESMARFGGYGNRLRDALEKVVAGDHEWFTKPVIDSYHTVWFELHEDLLSTLGIERASEGAR
jgi:DNA-binding MarR family transcriptional regulator